MSERDASTSIRCSFKGEDVDSAIRDFLEVATTCGRESLRELVSGPCGYRPGTAYKVAVLAMRYECGVPLWPENSVAAPLLR